jgi:hypothetical protein
MSLLANSILILYLRAMRYSTRVKSLIELLYIGRLLVLSKNVRLGRKETDLRNALAYHTAALISVVKSFIVLATRSQNVIVSSFSYVQLSFG